MTLSGFFVTLAYVVGAIALLAIVGAAVLGLIGFVVEHTWGQGK